MPTLFISDLHLDASRPALVATFLDFLARDAPGANALYILGDLFETWIGDDDDAPLAAQVAQGLSTLAATGVPIRFVHGNRDFLLGGDYAARCGMALLPEVSVHDVEGTPTLVMHGDTLCTGDVEYQRFRAQARDPAWQRAVLSQSLAQRRALAERARLESERHVTASMASIMDVDAGAVAGAMRAYGVARLVHGHTHRRASHAFEVDGSPAERWVLGDWYERGSVLEVRKGHTGFRSP
jgi:UDP-2,3-diacylglucosamine hydrolase